MLLEYCKPGTDSMLTALGKMPEKEGAGFVGEFADWAGIDVVAAGLGVSTAAMLATGQNREWPGCKAVGTERILVEDKSLADTLEEMACWC